MKRIGKKGRFVLLLVLQILVVLTMVAEIFNRNFYNVFLCLLTLVLFNIPRFVDLKLNIKLPTMLEVVIYYSYSRRKYLVRYKVLYDFSVLGHCAPYN